MRLSLSAVAKVVRRLEDQLARPALYNDRMPPSRVRSRYNRVLGWLGPIGRARVDGWCVPGERRYVPPPPDKVISRCGEAAP